MADFFASSGAGGNGCLLEWALDFDDSANTVTVSSTHKHFNGTAAPDPQIARVTITLNTTVDITLDLLTGRLLNAQGGQGQAFDGTATKIINSGDRTRTGVRLKISADRAALITHSTEYLPPA